MKLAIEGGKTSKNIQVFIQDSSKTDGSGLTGLLFNTAGLTAYYFRDGASSATVIALVTAVAGTYTSGGFIEISAANMPGWYEIGIPDAALVTGTDQLGITVKGAIDMVQVNLEIQLDPLPANLKEIDQFATNTNLATLNLKQLNIVNSTGSALVASSTGSNGHGITSIGNGVGHGINAESGLGASGVGILARSQAATGEGIRAEGAGTGSGIIGASGFGATGAGIFAQSQVSNGDGFKAQGTGTGHGINAQSGTGINADGVRAETNSSSGGNGLHALSTGSTGNGMKIVGGGIGHGIDIIAGSTAGAHGITIQGREHGINIVSGASATASGIKTQGSLNGIHALSTGNGSGIHAQASNVGEGMTATGGNNGSGFKAVGIGTGHGIVGESGTGINADGIRAEGAGSTGSVGLHAVATGSNGIGIDASGIGTGEGIKATGGALASAIFATASGGVGEAALRLEASGSDAVLIKTTAGAQAAIRIIGEQDGIVIGAKNVGIFIEQIGSSALSTGISISNWEFGMQFSGGRQGILMSTADECLDLNSSNSDAIKATAGGAAGSGVKFIGSLAGHGMTLIKGATGKDIDADEIDNIKTDTATINALTASTLDATISSRSFHDETDVDTVLTAAHGSGSWATASALTSQQIRDAMKLAPTAGAPTADSIDAELDTLIADTLFLRKLERNKKDMVKDAGDVFLIIYDDDNTTEIARMKLEKFGGGVIGELAGTTAPSLRSKSTI